MDKKAIIVATGLIGLGIAGFGITSQSQKVEASYLLKKATVPKKFRGTWQYKFDPNAPAVRFSLKAHTYIEAPSPKGLGPEYVKNGVYVAKGDKYTLWAKKKGFDKFVKNASKQEKGKLSDDSIKWRLLNVKNKNTITISRFGLDKYDKGKATLTYSLKDGKDHLHFHYKSRSFTADYDAFKVK